MELEYLTTVQAQLKKKANRHLEKLRHISEQQRELQRQAKLSPEQRAALRRGTVRGWQAWARTVVGRAQVSRLREALGLLSPGGTRVHSCTVGSGTAGGADEETEAALDALVRAPAWHWLACLLSPVSRRLFPVARVVSPVY